jgi:hypothetical protein
MSIGEFPSMNGEIFRLNLQMLDVVVGKELKDENISMISLKGLFASVSACFRYSSFSRPIGSFEAPANFERITRPVISLRQDWSLV